MKGKKSDEKSNKKDTKWWFIMSGNSKKVVNWFLFPLWLPHGNKWASCQSAELISGGPRLLINEMWEDKKTAVSGATAYPQSLTAFSDWANHPIVPQHFESGILTARRKRLNRTENCISFLSPLPSPLSPTSNLAPLPPVFFFHNASCAIHLAHFNGSLIII